MREPYKLLNLKLSVVNIDNGMKAANDSEWSLAAHLSNHRMSF